MAFLSSDLPTQAWEFQIHFHYHYHFGTTSAIWSKSCGWDMPPATGFREAKEKRALLFLFQPPASKAVPEQLIIEEK